MIATTKLSIAILHACVSYEETPLRQFQLLQIILYNRHVVSPYYSLDGTFTVSALSRLENKGLPVISSVIIRSDSPSYGQRVKMKKATKFLNLLMLKFFPGKPFRTWRALYEILTKLNLEELSQQIECCLSSESIVTYNNCESIL